MHIGVGFLRCSFSKVGNAKALKCGTSKSKIPTLFIYERNICRIKTPQGVGNNE